MPWLDCHDADSTLVSLAEAIETSRADLEHALREHDASRFEAAAEDPWELMPREVLEHFDCEAETVAGRFDGAFYFHGTRVIDPEAFRRRGILPLDQVVEELWVTLRELSGNEITDVAWAAFRRSVESGAGGHSGTLYRMKTGEQIHFGPFGLVVRETFFTPSAAGSHDYLGCPEIVQDIARCYAAAHSDGLERRFCDAAKPCIVKFRSTELRPGAIKAALWYAYTRLHDDEISTNSNYSFDGNGEAVRAEDVLNVELAE